MGSPSKSRPISRSPLSPSPPITSQLLYKPYEKPSIPVRPLRPRGLSNQSNNSTENKDDTTVGASPRIMSAGDLSLLMVDGDLDSRGPSRSPRNRSGLASPDLGVKGKGRAGSGTGLFSSPLIRARPTPNKNEELEMDLLSLAKEPLVGRTPATDHDDPFLTSPTPPTNSVLFDFEQDDASGEKVAFDFEAEWKKMDGVPEPLVRRVRGWSAVGKGNVVEVLSIDGFDVVREPSEEMGSEGARACLDEVVSTDDAAIGFERMLLCREGKSAVLLEARDVESGCIWKMAGLDEAVLETAKSSLDSVT